MFTIHGGASRETNYNESLALFVSFEFFTISNSARSAGKFVNSTFVDVKYSSSRLIWRIEQKEMYKKV